MKVRFFALSGLALSLSALAADTNSIDGVWQGDMMPATRPMAADLGYRGTAGWFCVSFSLQKKQASFAFAKGPKEYTAVLEKAAGGYRIRVGGRVIALVAEPRPMFGKMFSRIKREKGNEIETIGMDLMQRREKTASECVAALGK